MGYSSYGAAIPEGAAVPVAARNDGRRPVVQVRIDDPEWGVGPFVDKSLDQSPTGDSQGGPFVPGHPEPVLDADEDEDEANKGEADPEGLTGIELLEYRYLRLSPKQRTLSAVKLGELLHEGTGFTAGTARKYLGEIIRKHR
jgi:hypothetical protein